MNIETLTTWAQLVASLGVIGTVYYLALQVRQSTRSSRAAVVDSLARSMHDLAFEMAKNDQLLSVVTVTLNDWYGATELERARAASFLLGYFKVFENAWFQMRQGTLTPEQWQGYDAFVHMALRQSAVRPWWEQRRSFFAPAFREYVENCEVTKGGPTLLEVVHNVTKTTA